MFRSLLVLWSFRGRANRARYWPIVIGTGIISRLSGWAFVQYIGTEGIATLTGTILYLVVFAILTWLVLSVAVRRLHDRDKTGWWVIPMVVVPAVIAETVDFNIYASTADFDLTKIVLGAIVAGLWIWTFISLGCERGTEGANRFGPDPLAPESLPAPEPTAST